MKYSYALPYDNFPSYRCRRQYGRSTFPQDNDGIFTGRIPPTALSMCSSDACDLYNSQPTSKTTIHFLFCQWDCNFINTSTAQIQQECIWKILRSPCLYSLKTQLCDPASLCSYCFKMSPQLIHQSALLSHSSVYLTRCSTILFPSYEASNLMDVLYSCSLYACIVFTRVYDIDTSKQCVKINKRGNGMFPHPYKKTNSYHVYNIFHFHYTAFMLNLCPSQEVLFIIVYT